MSHFTEVKTQIKNLEFFKKALKELGFDFVCDLDSLTIENFFGDKTSVELLIKTGTKYDIGLRLKEDNTYELVADWELLEKMKYDTKKVQETLLQKYSYITVKDSLEQQGYEVDEEVVDEEGNIELVVAQW
ncbi:MAG: DUF1257 domain-containing protein [Halobacteriovoraceae bacterium]|nr:DUF1257 domain-containing protein [Halobacteriovoraceae bacterium]